MAIEKRKYINYVSPAGIAIWPRVNKPDTKFNKEGVYSVRLRFRSDDAAVLAFIAKYTETLDAFEETTKAKLLDDPKTAKKASKMSRVEIGKPEVNDNDEETGHTIINFKLNASFTNEKGEVTKYQPKLFDAKNKATTASVWGGSTLKVAGTVNPYYTAKDNQVGISFRMSGVQILKLVSGTGQSADGLGFTEQEGGFEDSGGFEDAPAPVASADSKPEKGADF